MSILAKVAICMACHGPSGGDNVPHINGQKAEYMYNELLKFKQGTRQSVMNGIVSGYSAEDLKKLAEYFSKQPWGK